MNLQKLATRLKDHISNDVETVADEGLVELADAHLTLVSAAHGSCHTSGHNSNGHGSSHQSGSGAGCDKIQAVI